MIISVFIKIQSIAILKKKIIEIKEVKKNTSKNGAGKQIYSWQNVSACADHVLAWTGLPIGPCLFLSLNVISALEGTL